MKESDFVFFENNEECSARRMVSFATEFGLSGNLWHQWMAYRIIADENPCSLACERHSVDRESTMAELAKPDFARLFKLFNEGPSDFTGIDDFMGVFGNYIPPYACAANTYARERIMELAAALEGAKDEPSFAAVIMDYYEKYGAGIYGIYNSFRAEVEDSTLKIVPVMNAADISFDTLVGYDDQKQTLKDNTESFLRGRPANNALLYGDSGTGKSTSIHALIHEYGKDGLRMVEVGKRERAYLPEIISELKKRNYKFIIFMDDLSFEEDESDYKELKAMLEGALESSGDNVLIYATSNRRHLIRETWSDRSDMEHDGDVHRSDTMEEKLSLAGRFGITVYYGKPDYKEYMNIVRELAKREGLAIGDDELEDEARKWSIKQGSTSGRSASQLIKHLTN